MYLTLLRVLPDEVILRISMPGGESHELRLNKSQSIRIDRLAEYMAAKGRQARQGATAAPPAPPPSGPPTMTYLDPSYFMGRSEG